MMCKTEKGTKYEREYAGLVVPFETTKVQQWDQF